jgi:hypothetical protein
MRMAISFDALGYARHLRKNGAHQEQAGAMADTARTYTKRELVTREELRLALGNVALRLTVRTDIMIAAAAIVLGTLDALMTPQGHFFEF